LAVLSVLLSFSSVQTKLAQGISYRVNSKYSTSILVDKVDLSSLRNIELKNVLIKDHHQDTLFYIGSLRTSILNYKNIFNNSLNFGDIEIENGKFLMKTYKSEKQNGLTLFVDKFKKNSDSSKNSFQLTSSSIQLNDVNFTIIDENRKDTPIVYYQNIHGNFDNFRANGPDISASINGLKTTENHKIKIVDFKSEFSYSATKMEFLETQLSTDNSNVSADIVFKYKEGDLAKFTDSVQIDAQIKNSDIALADLKKFYGEFGKNDRIHFSGMLKGTLNNFVLKDLDIKSNRSSSLRGTLSLKDVLHPNKFNLEADLDELSSSYDHLINLLPNLLGNKIPSSFDKIGYFTSHGHLKVTRSSVYLKLDSQAEIGDSKVDIQLTNIDQINNASYKGKIELIDFNLGKFVNDSLIGDFSMIGEVEGKGFSIDNINIKVDGIISKHQYKGYTYSNIDINGVLKNKHFHGELIVNDPNIKLVFKGLADLSGNKNVFNFNADVAFANFNKLHLFTRDEKSVLKGKIDINLKGSNLDNIEGDLNFINASYSNQNDIYQFNDFYITSKRTDSVRQVTIDSKEIINGSIKGNFKFRELGKLTKNSMGSLFVNYKKKEVAQGQFLDFKFNIYNKIVEVFFPDLKLGANTVIKGEINSDEDKFNLSIKSPKVEAFDFFIENIDMQIDNKNPLYNTLLSVDRLNTNYYNLEDVNLVNVVLNDTLFIQTDFIGGKDLKEKYNLSFYHTINENNQPVFGIKKSEIFFKNNSWKINPNNNQQNKIIFEQSYTTYAIDNINMVSGNQQIDLAGLVDGKDSRNIDLTLQNVNLFDVTPSIDSVAISGKLNGTLNLKSINGKTVPFADLVVNYFSINDDFYGDLTLKASSDENIKNYIFEAVLLNSDLKSFSSKGNIDFNTPNPIIIAEVLFDRFKINAFSPLGKNVLSKMRGYASGSVSVTGLMNNPNIDGEIVLKDAGFKLPYLNVDYNFIGNSVVKLYDQTFDFLSIDIEDKAMKTKGIMKGTILHNKFKKWYLDLELSTDNLLVLNTKETEEAFYYGTGLLAGRTSIKGFTDELIIDVEGKTNRGTEFIIPLSDVSTINESRLIHFENKSVEVEKAKNEEIVFEKLKGLNINFNLQVTKDAIAQIVVDKISGSTLRGSGDGNLRLNIDTNGKFEMYGAIVVDNGEYQFNSIVNKTFEVRKGGTIIWNGNPFEADINIVAVNYTKANPAVLLDEVAGSRKIEVELITSMSGKLSAPNFDFDINIPNSSSLVASELDFKLRNEDEKLTQFFSLLATGNFTKLNQNKTNFDGNAAIYGTIAQKASQLLSNMLVSENEDFQVGITYDVGSNNDVKNVITDDQLGVEVSGRIADRVIVNGRVGVPVGSSTTSNVIGEVVVIVPLNDAETFNAKVYNRQNEIQFDVVEGEGYTQGAGVSYRFDFDNSKEFLNKIGLKKNKKEKKAIKKKKDSIRKIRKSLRNE
jgi:TamB, inner membrane protein subunit of TAM complex